MKKPLGETAPVRQRKERYFQGLPVREGRGDILVQPTKNDIKQAVRYDPERCAYACCLRRMLETSRVFVYTTVCYIEVLDEKGDHWMERYVITDHAHAYIQRFDNGELVGPGGFLLKRPTGGKTLEHKRKQSRHWYKTHPEEVKRTAKAYYERAKDKRKNPQARQLTGTFRDGTGMVKFIGTYDGKLATHKIEVE